MKASLRSGAPALVAALLLSVTGCGGSTVDDYCKDLSEHRKQMADMVASESPTALMSRLPMLRELADKAPEDLRDEWRTFVDAVGGLDKALDDAGVKASEFKDGQPPAGLSQEDRKAIADAVSQLRTDEVVQAASGIEQQARDVCKINFGT
jgi:hypothetical protein